MKKIHVFFLLFSIVVFGSCKKENNQSANTEGIEKSPASSQSDVHASPATRETQPKLTLFRNITASNVPVRAIATFSASEIVSGDDEGYVKLWDCGLLKWSKKEHNGKVFSVSTSQYKIISGGEDNIAIVWRKERGEVERKIEKNENWIFATGIELTRPGMMTDTYITAGRDKTIRYWLYQMKTSFGLEEKLLRYFEKPDAHDGDINCLQAFLNPGFEPKSFIFITGSDDKTVKIWDGDFNLIKQLNDHSDSISCVSSYNDLIISGSEDKSIIIYKINKSIEDQKKQFKSIKKVRTLTGHTEGVTCIAGVKGTDDRLLLASGSKDGTIKIWDVNSGKCLYTINIGTRVNCLLFDEYNKRLVGSFHDGTIRIYKIENI